MADNRERLLHVRNILLTTDEDYLSADIPRVNHFWNCNP